MLLGGKEVDLIFQMPDVMDDDCAWRGIEE
jgi:hypothetical protein